MPLDEASVRSLSGMMGPWFVLDERIPTAPGVSWPKFLSLIEKGKVAPGTVVRGPATGGLWTPAGRAPLVARHLGLCWSCQSPLPPDETLKSCPRCGRNLNGPANWPDPPPPDDEAASAQVEEEAGGAIDDLIEAGAAGRNGAARATPARGGRAGLILGVVLAALVGGGGMYAAITAFGPKRSVPLPPQPEPRWTVPEPAGRRSGGMFPEVPEGTRIGSAPSPLPGQRRTAQGRFEEARRYHQAGDLMAAQDILVSLINSFDRRDMPEGAEELLRDTQKRILASRPAGPSEEEISRRKQEARKEFDRAAALADQGKLLEAQSVLVEMLNGTDWRYWPTEAVGKLGDIQKRIVAGTRPADQPGEAELTRQQESARRLLQQAQDLIKEGSLAGAQKTLLEILNTHHAKAWPDGTLETFQRVKEAIEQPPASQPGFFGIEIGR